MLVNIPKINNTSRASQLFCNLCQTLLSVKLCKIKMNDVEDPYRLVV